MTTVGRADAEFDTIPVGRDAGAPWTTTSGRAWRASRGAMPLRDLVAGDLSWPERKRWPGVLPPVSELPPF